MGTWVAEIPGLPACYALSETRHLALAELRKNFDMIEGEYCKKGLRLPTDTTHHLGRDTMYLLAFVSLAISLPTPVSSQKRVDRSQSIPGFKEYAVREVYRGKAAKIVWPKDVDPHDPNLQRMVEAVEYTIRRKPNFAGHYAIVQYSCGTDCSQITIIDLKSGMVLEPEPYATLTVDLFPRDGVSYKGLSYKRNSRLLIASGCFDWDAPESKHECGTKYFEFRDDGFVLLKYVPGPVPKWSESQK